MGKFETRWTDGWTLQREKSDERQIKLTRDRDACAISHEIKKERKNWNVVELYIFRYLCVGIFSGGMKAYKNID